MFRQAVRFSHRQPTIFLGCSSLRFSTMKKKQGLLQNHSTKVKSSSTEKPIVAQDEQKPKVYFSGHTLDDPYLLYEQRSSFFRKNQDTV